MCVCVGGVGQLGGSAAGQACDKLTGIFVDKGGTTPPPLPTHTHTHGVTLPRPLATALSWQGAFQTENANKFGGVQIKMINDDARWQQQQQLQEQQQLWQQQQRQHL